MSDNIEVECYMGPDDYTFRIEEVQDQRLGITQFELHGTNRKTGYTWLAGEFSTRASAREAIARQRESLAKIPRKAGGE